MKFELSYTGIRVRDLDVSISFYRDLLGMELIGRSDVAETKGAAAALRSKEGGPILELNWYGRGSPFGGRYAEGAELDHLAFAVGNLREALETLKAAGHPVVQGPYVGKNASWAFVKDPDGIWIEIFEGSVT